MSYIDNNKDSNQDEDQGNTSAVATLEKPKVKDNSPAVILSASLVKKIKKV